MTDFAGILVVGKGNFMTLVKTDTTNSYFESLVKMIQAMQKDPVINEKVVEMLRLDPYRRRIILNNWLEQLQLQRASLKLLNAFACLFDDSIAERVLTLITNHQLKSTESD
jgi:ubiquinone biosynthesis protein Coq4